jgi:hypothetical protein
MGREATAACEWKGQRGTVKALLDSRELILRGDVRDKIARGDIAAVSVEGDALILDIQGARLTLNLGAAEAAKWQAALLKRLPTLAEKLGIDAARPAFVWGNTDDQELAAALAGATAPAIADASVLVAVLSSEAQLDNAFEIATTAPTLPLWCVYPKGKSADPSDSIVRTFMRDRGYMDNKTCAVSERLTATRYDKRG